MPSLWEAFKYFRGPFRAVWKDKTPSKRPNSFRRRPYKNKMPQEEARSILQPSFPASSVIGWNQTSQSPKSDQSWCNLAHSVFYVWSSTKISSTTMKIFNFTLKYIHIYYILASTICVRKLMKVIICSKTLFVC